MVNISKKIILLFGSILTLASLAWATVDPGVGATLRFTPDEKAWMAAHPVIRVAPDVDFPPVEYLDGREHFSGIAMDYLALLEKRLPLHFQIVHLKDWNEVMRQGRNRQIDMFSAAVPTPERLQFMQFTPPLMEFPAVIVSRNDADFPHRLKGLRGLRVAVVANYAAAEYMREAHPEVNLITVPDIVAGLRQVSFGKVDAMVLNLASATYYISEEGITNLQIYKDTNFIYDLSMASRNDWPMLGDILAKAVRSITPAERQVILERWVYLGSSGWQVPVWLGVTLGLLILAGIIFAFIIWNRTLRRQVEVKTRALQHELQERQKAERDKAILQQKIHRTKKMEALGLLAGGVAHDLNNVLSGIVGYPDLLLMQLPEDSPLRPTVLAIQDSGQRAAEQVSDLLTIARGAASEKKALDLNKVVQDYLDSPEHRQIMCRHPEIVVRFQPAAGEVLAKCSVSHLGKTVLNLVLNALEAMGEEGQLTITTRREILTTPRMGGYQEIAAGEYAVLTVGDTGPGISREDLENIFEPFYSKKKLGRSGTGLGLAIVWNTIEDHDGAIDIINLDPGTEFDLYFPTGNITMVNPERANNDAIQGHGETILVVDDEKQMRDIAARLLEYLGYEVAVAASGEEAVAYLKTNRVDLLILDMLMEPGMNGRETYEQALANNPGQRAIIVSGFSESSDVLRAKALGAGQFIRKPYTIEILGQAVQRELHPEENR